MSARLATVDTGIFSSFARQKYLYYRQAELKIKEDMLEIMLRIKFKPLKNKFMAYAAESGWNSITKQVLSMGFDVIVIDRWGGNYNIEQWPDSKTFWIENQQNLLISDNQTRLYENAGEEEKGKLVYLAWGKHE